MLSKHSHWESNQLKMGLLWFLLGLSVVLVVTAAITDSMLAYYAGFAAWLVSYIVDRSGGLD